VIVELLEENTDVVDTEDLSAVLRKDAGWLLLFIEGFLTDSPWVKVVSSFAFALNYYTQAAMDN